MGTNLLNLSLEIRLLIYRFYLLSLSQFTERPFYTIVGNMRPFNPHEPPQAAAHLRCFLVQDLQLVCRQIRDELLSEIVNHTILLIKGKQRYGYPSLGFVIDNFQDRGVAFRHLTLHVSGGFFRSKPLRTEKVWTALLPHLVSLRLYFELDDPHRNT